MEADQSDRPDRQIRVISSPPIKVLSPLGMRRRPSKELPYLQLGRPRNPEVQSEGGRSASPISPSKLLQTIRNSFGRPSMSPEPEADAPEADVANDSRRAESPGFGSSPL
eukprot:7290463-Prymnesium_polylepis.1